jgi:hypothetical protein
MGDMEEGKESLVLYLEIPAEDAQRFDDQPYT